MVSPYDYKDGLVHIDRNKTDGKYYSSKILWALGNFSRFVRPGIKRAALTSDNKDLVASACSNGQSRELVLAVVNESSTDKAVRGKLPGSPQNVTIYTTTDTLYLAKGTTDLQNLAVPAREVVTVMLNY